MSYLDLVKLRQSATLVITTFVLTLAGTVFSVAQDQTGGKSGLYASTFIGANFLTDSSFGGTVTPPGGTQLVNVDFNAGINLGGSIGYFLNGFDLGAASPRMELEVAYQHNDADTTDFSGNGLGNETNTGGSISSTTVMANVLLDINNSSRFTPFVGGGLGIAFTNIDIVYGGPAGGPPTVSLNDNDTNFAIQAIAGTSYEMSESLFLVGDVRYKALIGVDSDRFSPAGFTGSLSDDLSNFSVNTGIRYQF